MFHNGSTYDYHFIIKQLAEDFKDQFECLGENTEKYIPFSVPIKKEVANDDNSKKKKRTITYKLKFINSYRFMQIKLLDLVDNNRECLECMDKKINSECEFIGFKNDRLHYKCKECGKRLTKSKTGLNSTYIQILQ